MEIIYVSDVPTFREYKESTFSIGGSPSTVAESASGWEQAARDVADARSKLSSHSGEEIRGSLGIFFRELVHEHFEPLLDDLEKTIETAAQRIRAYSDDFHDAAVKMDPVAERAPDEFADLKSAADSSNEAYRRVLAQTTAENQKEAHKQWRDAYDAYLTARSVVEQTIRDGERIIDDLNQTSVSVSTSIESIAEPAQGRYFGNHGVPTFEPGPHDRVEIDTDLFRQTGNSIRDHGSTLDRSIDACVRLSRVDKHKGELVSAAVASFHDAWIPCGNVLAKRIAHFGRQCSHAATEIDEADDENARTQSNIGIAWSTTSAFVEEVFDNLPEDVGRLAGRAWAPIAATYDVAMFVDDVKQGEDLPIAVVSNAAGALSPVAGAIGGAFFGGVPGAFGGATLGILGGGGIDEWVEDALEEGYYGEADNLPDYGYTGKEKP